jgi:Flp pilus assembly protein TadB
MREPFVASGALLWGGAVLLLAELRWFRRASLVDRLRPHSPHRTAGESSSIWSVESFREVIAPLARSLGEAVARAAGVGEDVAVRLRRVHAPLDPSAFRVRQLGWATAAFGAVTVTVVAARLTAPVALFAMAAAPLLAFLIIEHRLAAASMAWQRRISRELPVVIEQLAMLLNAGYSLGSALNRLADRGRGATARDMGVVCSRIRQGLTEAQALAEWAAVAKVAGLDRLLPLLVRTDTSSDLGRLLSGEARALRQEAHRERIAIIERRGQQVWVPVTVATLVPGVIFLCVPFVEALHRFSGT